MFSLKDGGGVVEVAAASDEYQCLCLTVNTFGLHQTSEAFEQFEPLEPFELFEPFEIFLFGQIFFIL